MGGGNGRKGVKVRMKGRIALWEEEIKSLQQELSPVTVSEIVNCLVGGLNIGDAVQREEVKRILAGQFEKGEFNPDDFRGVIHDSGKLEKLFEALHTGGFMQEEAFLPNASALQALGIKSL